MKKAFQHILALTLCMAATTACQEGNDNWRVISNVQAGTYITGDATIYSAPATAAQLNAPDFDPQDTEADVLSIYTWLKKTGTFRILEVDVEGKQQSYGATTTLSSDPFQTILAQPGGKDFSVTTEGLYCIVFNRLDKQVSIIPADFGIIGDATPKQWSDETPMKGSLDEEHALVEYTLKDVSLDKKELKFRYLHSWGVEVPYAQSTVKIHSNMGGVNKGILSEAYSLCKGGGENFSLTRAGVYDITLKLDLRKGTLSVRGICTAEDATGAKLPDKMFITGDAWQWKWDLSPEMIPIHSHDGSFWGIYSIKALQGLKFNSEMSWTTGDAFGVETKEPKGYGHYSAGGENLVVNADGLYLVVVKCTLSADKKTLVREVQMAQPVPFLIGDAAAAGWASQLTDKDRFTLNKNGEYVSPPCNTGNLRMCIKLDGCDWWQTEFNVFDGKIQYRGRGGDQAPVAVTAGQVVTLNFKDNTASIK